MRFWRLVPSISSLVFALLSGEANSWHKPRMEQWRLSLGQAHLMWKTILEDNGLCSIDIANYKSPTQTVISGPINEIGRAKQVFQPPRAEMYIELSVSAAFHWRYMKEPAEAFGSFIEQFRFFDLSASVISNVTAKPYPRSNFSSTIEASLVQQIVSPVRWDASIRYLKSEGVTQFLEIGPGDLLSRLTQKILFSET